MKFFREAIGAMRAFNCSHASKTAAPYISELADAAVADALGTYITRIYTVLQRGIAEYTTGRTVVGKVI